MKKNHEANFSQTEFLVANCEIFRSRSRLLQWMIISPLTTWKQYCWGCIDSIRAFFVKTWDLHQYHKDAGFRQKYSELLYFAAKKMLSSLRMPCAPYRIFSLRLTTAGVGRTEPTISSSCSLATGNIWNWKQTSILGRYFKLNFISIGLTE